MRVAYASPLPPSGSGIADYSAELLPALAEAGLELTLFLDGRGAAAGELTRRFPVRSLSELVRRRRDFDLLVYQLGNSAEHHAEILRLALELPGVAVLHEFMLHHLVRAVTLGRGDGEAYVEEMRYCAGETGRRAARRLLDTHYPVDTWRFPLFERVVDRSLGVLVHSEFARARVLASRPAAAVDVVPFPVDTACLRPPREEARRAARSELGIAPGDFVIATFGLVTPHKRLEPALGAFAGLRRERPEARFWVCGEVSPYFDLEAALDAGGRDGVTVTGRVDLERFHTVMRACDLAVNLRHPTGGETSASLMRLLALGVPTVVTDAGSFAELPDGAAARVAVGELEREHLLALFSRFASDAGLRAAVGRAARRWIEARHGLATTAAAYAESLARCARLPAPAAPAPPLARWRESDPRVALVASVGAAVVDLGLGAWEAELGAELAGELARLGWAPRGPDGA